MSMRRFGVAVGRWTARFARLLFILPLMAFWTAFGLSVLGITALTWYGAALLVVNLL